MQIAQIPSPLSKSLIFAVGWASKPLAFASFRRVAPSLPRAKDSSSPAKYNPKRASGSVVASHRSVVVAPCATVLFLKQYKLTGGWKYLHRLYNI